MLDGQACFGTDLPGHQKESVSVITFELLRIKLSEIFNHKESLNNINYTEYIL